MLVNNRKYKEQYHEYVLENGLHVVLWKKNGYKKSLFMIATPFGALDIEQENNNKEKQTFPSGIAHFLEHKMFAMKNSDVMELFAQMQANVNAFTSYSETAYYFSTSCDFVEPLNLLLDFSQKLEIDAASVEKEKGIIIQELNMYHQMSESRLLMETFTSLFTNHPLKYDIGGTPESVGTTTLEQLMTCYQNNYHPSTMILFGIGDFDEEQVIKLISDNQAKKKFEKVADWKRIFIQEKLEVARKEFTFHMDVAKAKISIAYKLHGIEDVYERQKMEMSIKILLDQYFSAINENYQTWIDDEIVNDYSGCEVDIGSDYGFIMFYGESDKIADFVKVVRAVYSLLLDGQTNHELLEQLKRRYYGQSLRNLNHFDEIAIGYIRNFFDKADFFRSMDIQNQISKDDIYEARKYLCEYDECIVYLLPDKQ